jgi:hypothetical protein
MKNFYFKNAGTAKLIILSLILTVLFTGCERIKAAYSKKIKPK